MSAEFLLEIGTEELPSSFVTHGLRSMEQAAKDLIRQARLGSDSLEATTMGTPRRLALRLRGLSATQPDRQETVVGPPWSAAFDKDGTPKKAAVGFAKKHGVEVDALRKQATEKGDYVSVEIHEPGRPTDQVLREILPELCARITFPKTMRWGSGDVAFGRPIHWIVSLLGSEVVDFEYAGVRSGRTTRGHRFLAPQTFELGDATSYVDALAAAHVVVELDVRGQRMLDALVRSAQSLGGILEPDAFLANECVSLVEEPFVVPGRYDDAFLALPDEVVIAVMRDHQRYFAVRAAEGGDLMPAYLNVVNTAEEPLTIATGNDRVLHARLADARFFVEEDQKAPLLDRLRKLESVVFQSKLGTMGAKVRRIEGIARALADHVGADANAAGQAARLCKADLETLIVYEFPELQGEMGRWYGLREGIDPAVADAIRDHYRPQGADDLVPDQVVGAIVAVADRIDTLVGCFGIGLVPSGSADPFALRRAALGIVRIALEGPIDVDLRKIIDQAYAQYAGDAELAPADQTRTALDEFFRGRIRVLARDHYEGDVVDACIGAWDGSSIRDLRTRMDAVTEVRAAPEFEALATAFKRAFNITKESARGAVDPTLLESGPESELADRFTTVRDQIREATTKRRYAEALKLVAKELGAPIDRFFDEVFVMVDDANVRENRLRLLGEIADAVNGIAHLHQLATKSERRDPAISA
ncbi:MAG: glycine--tRNA ligase subunit beta [Myxococcales bacterium]|nr:glycine--tRNA ligase subunit beta [Myxococcales bacterium]MDH3486221.1 glycine--tRNA ligase subunit beta [Myxococcales bacterium]